MVAKRAGRHCCPRTLRCLLLPIVAALAACGWGSDGPPADAEPAVAAFVGGDVCRQCHEPEGTRWSGSHHDLAMQPVTAGSVLGDFDDAAFEYAGITTRFFRRDGDYVVSTDGPDGEIAEFAVRHSFGVYPLQQYLIELEEGRVQALSIAWDARPANEGGQRWFHLYPDEAIDYRDPLHWTGVYQRWNTMCADCHSTNLEKAYDATEHRFATRWSSVDVDCEACHGPGSLHAANPQVAPPALPARDHRWELRSGESIATRVPAAAGSAEVEICATCHSLRTQLVDAPSRTAPFLDAYRPSLLEEGLYHADGQIQGEVYVYGSFLQSAMARAGVTCSDCHDPHSGELRASGNAVCGQCHLPTTYDVIEHHHHEVGSPGAECTSCHMRSETFMVVDPRRDHSFRIPRPDLSAPLGSPNACNDCHADETSSWAADRIAAWFPPGRQGEPHYGEVLHAARAWSADAHLRLIGLIADFEQPGIVRATALQLLPLYLTLADTPLLARSLEDDDPLVQLAAIDASAELPPAVRIDLLQRFLRADRLALRVAAGRALANARSLLSDTRRVDLDAALDEYLDSQVFNSDRVEGVLNVAAIAQGQGRNGDAERLLLDAIDRFPAEAALLINLADLYRGTGRAADAEQALREALELNPSDPAAPLALGFALVRDDRATEALPLFEQAAALAPDQPYYQYVLAIATNDAGDAENALSLLRAVHERFPGYADALVALATLLRDAGAYAEAYEFAERLSDLRPGDDGAQSLLRELEQRL